MLIEKNRARNIAFYIICFISLQDKTSRLFVLFSVLLARNFHYACFLSLFFENFFLFECSFLFHCKGFGEKSFCKNSHPT